MECVPDHHRFRASHPWPSPFGLGASSPAFQPDRTSARGTPRAGSAKRQRGWELDHPRHERVEEPGHCPPEHHVILSSSQEEEEHDESPMHRGDDDFFYGEFRPSAGKRQRLAPPPGEIADVPPRSSDADLFSPEEPRLVPMEDWFPVSGEAFGDTGASERFESEHECEHEHSEWWKNRPPPAGPDSSVSRRCVVEQEARASGTRGLSPGGTTEASCHVCHRAFRLPPPAPLASVMPANALLNYFAPLRPQKGRDAPMAKGAPLPASKGICACCDRPVCKGCRKRCGACAKHFCSFCTITVGEHEGEVPGTFCLDCC